MGLPAQVMHRFGGSWTEIKLNAISDYLSFYTMALKARPSASDPFETWYVDAFAGTGDRDLRAPDMSMFAPPPGTLDRARLQGSARRALAIDPPFQHYVFIEKDGHRHAALEALQTEHPGRDVRCPRGDANDILHRVLSDGPWRAPGRKGLQRAVVFLDPYGMSVRWETLRFLAETRRADVWYLFPLHAALRQLAHDHAAVDAGKRSKLDEIFGTPDWERRFYEHAQQGTDLFDQPLGPNRAADPDKVERFAAERLRSIFTFVSDPIPILTRRRLRQFSLFCMSGNPARAATDLIRKGVTAQIRKYGGRTVG